MRLQGDTYRLFYRGATDEWPYRNSPSIHASYICRDSVSPKGVPVFLAASIRRSMGSAISIEVQILCQQATRGAPVGVDTTR